MASSRAIFYDDNKTKRLLNTETYDKYRKTIEDFIELLKSL